MIPTEVSTALLKAITSRSWLKPRWSTRRPRVVDQLFEETADRQYTPISFLFGCGLMSLVVCRIRPSINAAYQKNAVPINVSLPALYGKIERIELAEGRVRGPRRPSVCLRSSPP